MKIISLNKGGFAFILGVFLWCSHLHANFMYPNGGLASWQSTVSGTVSDGSGPLPGVTIIVKGTSLSTVTDDNGHYSIAAALGDTVVFSFVGFTDSQHIVRSAVLDVVMQEDTAQLQEVVINAGYYSVKDKERTGSIARITSKDIEGQPVTNVLATMQGRMAGVSITQNTGVPGGGFDIQIRGINSLRQDGNNPLYIIDGVPYPSSGVGSGLTGVVLPGGPSPLNSINPADIASIEVLKDADATAIYGSRGANGVVLVSTKKGSPGKTRFNLATTTGFGRVTRLMKLMDTRQYLEMRREAFANDGIEPGFSAYDVNGTWDPDRFTDWQDVFLGGTAVFNDLRGSLSGGTERTQFSLNTNLHKETTVLPGDFSYGKGNVMASISHGGGEAFTIQFTAGYTFQDNSQPGMDITQQAALLAPNAPRLYNDDGELNWEDSTWANPLANYESRYQSKTADLLANTTLSYRLLPGLVAKASMGFTDMRFEDSRTAPSSMYDPAYGLGSDFSSIYVNTVSRRSWIIEPQLNYERHFGRARLEVLAGGTFQNQATDQFVQEANGYSTNSLIYNLSAANNTFVLTDNETAYKYAAGYGRVNLSWGQRYFLNLTGRRDGSSRFGPGKQFATFGAVGAAWIFSEDLFASKNSVVSFGKLRGSYGTSGNDQIGDYQFMDTYTTTGNNYNGINALMPARLFNPDFAWETNKKLELALEAGFLKDRIFLSAALFSNRSSNQLVGIPLPATTGFPTIQANLDAVVENRGFELALRTENIKATDFSWATNFNFTALRNELVAFPDLEGSTYQSQYQVGEPLNIRKVFEYTGIDPQTGLYTFRDFNGDGEITAEQDRQAVKDLNPEFFGGLQNTIAYKGWYLDFLFQFVKQQNFSGAYTTGVPGTMTNQPASSLERWQQPGDVAGLQRYTTGVNSAAMNTFYKYYQSDAMITDASFIRLKNIVLSYTLPDAAIKGIRCRVMVQGQNLLTITSYDGADPESRYTSNMPPLKTVTAGVELTF